MPLKTTLSILVFCLILSTAMAQEPVPLPIGECKTANVEERTGDSREDEGYQPFIIPGSYVYVRGDLCTEYSLAGWEETMRLHLGEGAEEYMDLIELAVKVWNEAITLKSGDPLIEIIEWRPETYSIQRSFWSDPGKYAQENLEDDESVIYFSPAGEHESRVGGMAQQPVQVLRRK